MKKIQLTFLIILTFSFSFAQETVIVGDKVYQSTPEFVLYQISNGRLSLSSVNVSIGMLGQQGVFFISTSSIDGRTRIGGQLLIYLSDNTVIKCVDRNIRDHVNGIATTVYSLTPEEISRMETVNIEAVRYSIVSQFDKSDYLVSNTNHKEGGPFGREIKKIDFPMQIRSLK